MKLNANSPSTKIIAAVLVPTAKPEKKDCPKVKVSFASIKEAGYQLKSRAGTMLTILLSKKKEEENIVKRKFLSISIKILQTIGDMPDFEQYFPAIEPPASYIVITQGKYKWKEIVTEINNIVKEVELFYEKCDTLHKTGTSYEFMDWAGDAVHFFTKVDNILNSEKNPYLHS